MPSNKMLGEMLDEAVKRIQHCIQHLKIKFVFDLNQTSSNINLQILDDPTGVVPNASNISSNIGGGFQHTG